MILQSLLIESIFERVSTDIILAAGLLNPQRSLNLMTVEEREMSIISATKK